MELDREEEVEEPILAIEELALEHVVNAKERKKKACEVEELHLVLEEIALEYDRMAQEANARQDLRCACSLLGSNSPSDSRPTSTSPFDNPS